MEAPQFTTDIFSRKLGTAGEKISENLSTLLSESAPVFVPMLCPFTLQRTEICRLLSMPVSKIFCAGCGSQFRRRRFSKPCAAIELAKLCRWARLPQPSGCVKQGLGKALPNKIPMGQNERNAKSGTSVESCSLLLQTSFHFTTGIFSAKSRVYACKHFVNVRLLPAIRRCNFFCFYGIAAAAELRRTNGNIANTIGNID